MSGHKPQGYPLGRPFAQLSTGEWLHVWSPDSELAGAGIFAAKTFTSCLRIYGPLFVAARLVRGPGTKDRPSATSRAPANDGGSPSAVLDDNRVASFDQDASSDQDNDKAVLSPYDDGEGDEALAQSPFDRRSIIEPSSSSASSKPRHISLVALVLPEDAPMLARRVLMELEALIGNTLRSSAFLACHAGGFILLSAVFRRLLGKNTLYTSALLPGGLAGAAVLIEKPSRRRALALYVLQQSLVSTWRKLEMLGVVSSIPMGDVALTGVALASLAAQRQETRASRHVDSTIDDGMAFLLAPGAQTSRRMQRREISIQRMLSIVRTFLTEFLPAPKANILVHLLEDALKLPLSTKTRKRMRVCGILAALVSLALTMVKRLRRTRSRHVGTNGSPSMLVRAASIGLSVAMMPACYDLASWAVRSAARRYLTVLDKDTVARVSHAAGGFAAALPTVTFRSPTASVYLALKAAEALITHQARKHEVGVPRSALDVLIYAISSGLVVHYGTVEPRMLSKSYFRFFDTATQGLISQIRRDVFQELGVDSSLPE